MSSITVQTLQNAASWLHQVKLMVASNQIVFFFGQLQQYSYRVSDSAFHLSWCERIVFVSTDNQIWQRVHAQSEVVCPVDRCYVQRQWTQMRLTDKCLCELYHSDSNVLLNLFSFYNNHQRFTTLVLELPGWAGARRKSSDFYGARQDNRGRHTAHWASGWAPLHPH